ERGDVRPVREQLLLDRRAFGMVEAGGEPPRFRQLPAARQRQAQRLDVALVAAFRIAGDAVHARAQVELEGVPGTTGDAEQAGGTRVGRRDEGFLADRGEAAVAGLQAHGALPARVPERGLHAALGRLLGERRPGLVAFELDVVVLGAADAEAQAAALAPGL